MRFPTNSDSFPPHTLQICLSGGSGPCCDSDYLNHPGRDQEIGALDPYVAEHGLGDCHDFLVPDYR